MQRSRWCQSIPYIRLPIGCQSLAYLGGGLRLPPLQPTVIFMIVFLAVLLIFKKKISKCRHSLTNKKAQLSLTNPCNAKACQKLLQLDVKTSCRQVNDLFEVLEFGFLKYLNLAIIQRYTLYNVDRVRGL